FRDVRLCGQVGNIASCPVSIIWSVSGRGGDDPWTNLFCLSSSRARLPQRGQLTHWLNPPECKKHSPQGHRRLRQRIASVRSPLKALARRLAWLWRRKSSRIGIAVIVNCGNHGEGLRLTQSLRDHLHECVAAPARRKCAAFARTPPPPCPAPAASAKTTAERKDVKSAN